MTSAVNFPNEVEIKKKKREKLQMALFPENKLHLNLLRNNQSALSKKLNTNMSEPCQLKTL